MEKNNTIVDLLNRQPFIDRLKYIADLLSKGKKNACYAINGEWGSGKSFVLDMFEKEIAEIETDDGSDYRYMLFHYNCWQYDYYDEPLIAIVAAIQDYIAEGKNFGITDEAKTKLTGAVKVIAENLIGSFSDQIKTKLGFDLVTLVKNSIEGIKDGTTKWEENHSFDPHFQFKKTISSLQEELKEFAKERTIVFVVDELDRCIPVYAVKVLERLHHLFDGIPNVQLILAINRKQLEATIGNLYGFCASDYLEKFIDFQLTLTRGEITKSIWQMYSYYFNRFVESEDEALEANSFIITLLKDIPMRTINAIIDRSYLCHCLLSDDSTKVSNKVLCAEIFLTLLKHYGIDCSLAKDAFETDLFIAPDILRELDGNLPGLTILSQDLKPKGKSMKYLGSARGHIRIDTNNVLGYILAAYRTIIGFTGDYWLDCAPKRNTDQRFILSFWKLLKILN